MTPTKTLVYQPTGAVLSPGLRPGDTVTVPEDEAERLLRGGAFQRQATTKPSKTNEPVEPVKKEQP